MKEIRTTKMVCMEFVIPFPQYINGILDCGFAKLHYTRDLNNYTFINIYKVYWRKSLVLCLLLGINGPLPCVRVQIDPHSCRQIGRFSPWKQAPDNSFPKLKGGFSRIGLDL